MRFSSLGLADTNILCDCLFHGRHFIFARDTSRIFLKRIPVLALVTGVFVMIFGFLTIYLHDDTFIKIKPTVVNTLFAFILSAGLYFRRPVLKLALGEILRMQDEGWRLLTLRWIASLYFWRPE